MLFFFFFLRRYYTIVFSAVLVKCRIELRTLTASLCAGFYTCPVKSQSAQSLAEIIQTLCCLTNAPFCSYRPTHCLQTSPQSSAMRRQQRHLTAGVTSSESRVGLYTSHLDGFCKFLFLVVGKIFVEVSIKKERACIKFYLCIFCVYMSDVGVVTVVTTCEDDICTPVKHE